MVKEHIIKCYNQVLKVYREIVDGYHGELIRLIKFEIERLILTGKYYRIS